VSVEIVENTFLTKFLTIFYSIFAAFIGFVEKV
jgi:hypothetical protein